MVTEGKQDGNHARAARSMVRLMSRVNDKK